MEQPPYSSDLTPADYYLCPCMKNLLKVRRFANAEDNTPNFKDFLWKLDRKRTNLHLHSPYRLYTPQAETPGGNPDRLAKVYKKRRELRGSRKVALKQTLHLIPVGWVTSPINFIKLEIPKRSQLTRLHSTNRNQTWKLSVWLWWSQPINNRFTNNDTEDDKLGITIYKKRTDSNPATPTPTLLVGSKRS